MPYPNLCNNEKCYTGTALYSQRGLISCLLHFRLLVVTLKFDLRTFRLDMNERTSPPQCFIAEVDVRDQLSLVETIIRVSNGFCRS